MLFRSKRHVKFQIGEAQREQAELPRKAYPKELYKHLESSHQTTEGVLEEKELSPELEELQERQYTEQLVKDIIDDLLECIHLQNDNIQEMRWCRVEDFSESDQESMIDIRMVSKIKKKGKRKHLRDQRIDMQGPDKLEQRQLDSARKILRDQMPCSYGKQFTSAANEQSVISQIANWAGFISEATAPVGWWTEGRYGSHSVEELIHPDVIDKQPKSLIDQIDLYRSFYSYEDTIFNFDRQFYCIRGKRGLHLYTMADIKFTPFRDDGSFFKSKIPDLMIIAREC